MLDRHTTECFFFSKCERVVLSPVLLPPSLLNFQELPASKSEWSQARRQTKMRSFLPVARSLLVTIITIVVSYDVSEYVVPIWITHFCRNYIWMLQYIFYKHWGNTVLQNLFILVLQSAQTHHLVLFKLIESA